LICGLFFGLGYSLGRRAPSEANQFQSVAAAASNLQPSFTQPKPSAISQTGSSTVPEPATSDPQATDDSSSTPATAAPQDDSAQTGTEPKTAKATDATTPAPQLVKQTTAPLATQPAATTLTSIPAAAIPTAAIPTGAIMVQIAAISNPTDANVLVGALQKRGYSVTTRHIPSDSLIHVQVGPFSNRTDAIAMRQKLLSDGYNAILK
jgi:DedD protein